MYHPRYCELMIGCTGATSDSHGPIGAIDSANPLELGKFSILDDDSVISIEFCGGLLAGISIGGQVKIWQVGSKPDQPNWPLLRVLRDADEPEIDEFLTGAFLPNGHFVAAGKRKLRHGWDDAAEDSKILPGILKIFDLKTGNCVQRIHGTSGHIDEILYLKAVRTSRSGNFIVSCGQDGRLCRWAFSEDWGSFKGVQFGKLGKLAFHFDQMSDELVAVAVDNGLIVYDILSMRHVRAFKTGFTSYCDFVKIISRSGSKFRFLLRGVELLKTDTQQPSAPNSIIMTEVDLSMKSSAKLLSRLRHPLYEANSWLIKPGITSNSCYLAAPTITGRVLVFNVKTGQMTACLHAHDDSEVRQVAFHERLPIMATCGDDGRIRIYYSKRADSL